MSDSEQMKESRAAYSAPTADLSQPIILQRDGKPIAALISIEEYERYQASLREREFISAPKARRLADRAVFRDLVGCALSSGEPEWSTTPQPHWRVPYRGLNGVLLATIDVDAHTQSVSLTEEQRTALLEKVEQLATHSDAAA